MLFWNEGGWEKDIIDYFLFSSANEIERKNKEGHYLTHKDEIRQNWVLPLTISEWTLAVRLAPYIFW